MRCGRRRKAAPANVRCIIAWLQESHWQEVIGGGRDCADHIAYCVQGNATAAMCWLHGMFVPAKPLQCTRDKHCPTLPTAPLARRFTHRGAWTWHVGSVVFLLVVLSLLTGRHCLFTPSILCEMEHTVLLTRTALGDFVQTSIINKHSPPSSHSCALQQLFARVVTPCSTLQVAAGSCLS